MQDFPMTRSFILNQYYGTPDNYRTLQPEFEGKSAAPGTVCRLSPVLPDCFSRKNSHGLYKSCDPAQSLRVKKWDHPSMNVHPHVVRYRSTAGNTVFSMATVVKKC